MCRMFYFIVGIIIWSEIAGAPLLVLLKYGSWLRARAEPLHPIKITFHREIRQQ